MTNPVFEREGLRAVTGCIVPVYPLTAGVGQSLLHRAIRQGLDEGADRLPDLLPAELDEEGFPEIALMYRNIAIAEKGHEERYRAFIKNIETASVFAKEGEVVWQCRNCGFIYTGKEAPQVCPACLHPQAYFEVKKENY